MPIQVLMPALSPTMTEGKLARWTKNPGDSIASGDVVAEVETDKATMEVEAVEEGTLGRQLVAEGTENIPVNTPIGLILAEGEDESALDAAEAEAKKAAQGAQPAAQEAPRAETSPPQQATATVPAAPAEDPDADEPPLGETKTMTVREALRDAMAEEMRRDGEVFVMGEEVAQFEGAYKVTQGLLAEFGDKRVVDTPITEHGFTGLAVGAAFRGLKPIVEFMTFNFAMQAMDHLVNSAAKTLYMSGGQMPVPIVFRGPNGAAARVGAQHSQCYASWYAHIPGLKVVSPFSAADAKGLIKAAVRDPNPVIVLENEILYGHSSECPVREDYILPFGKAKVERSGTDVTLVAFSRMVDVALQAAETLAGEGIQAEVINLRSLRPLDRKTLCTSLRKTNRLVTIEEGWVTAGIGAEIAAVVMEDCFDWLDAPVMRVAGADVPMPYAANLEHLATPQPPQVVEAAKQVCYVK